MKGRNKLTALAINAAPWEPPSDMVKQQCPDCRYFFAAPMGVEEQRCPDCEIRLDRQARVRGGAQAA